MFMIEWYSKLVMEFKLNYTVMIVATSMIALMASWYVFFGYIY